MIYNCTKDFNVESIDDNGFPIKNQMEKIHKGSMWKRVFDETLTGAEVRLEELIGLSFIELSEERLQTHFSLVES